MFKFYRKYRIRINKPSRYGQRPSSRLLADLSGHGAATFFTREDAEREVERIKATHTYRNTPHQYRPTYEIV